MSEPFFEQCLRYFECDPCSAQRFAGILAPTLIGIYDCKRLRQAVWPRKMVIGDDQVHARTAGALSRGKGASAGINTDNQTNASGSCALDHVSTKIVTF